MSKFSNSRLYFVTRNQNKVDEIDRLLADSQFEIGSLDDLGFSGEIPEPGGTIEENSRLKVDFIRDRFDVDCFADDSGLEVEALNWQPGVYSARYAGLPTNDENNLRLLLKNLEDISNRNARFKTVITLYQGGDLQQFTGIIKGTITHKPIGGAGFGYDPVFQPDGYDQTFAQMTMAEKNSISHRGRAIRSLIQYLKTI